MISNNGRFVIYKIEDDFSIVSKTVLKDTKNNRSFFWINITQIQFSGNSKQLIYIKNDSLFIMELEAFTANATPRVASFKLIPRNNTEWITYIQIKEIPRLFLVNLETGENRSIDNATAFLFSDNSDKIFVVSKFGSKQNSISMIRALDFNFQNMYTVWTGKEATDLVTSPTGSILVFRASNPTKDSTTLTLWYYKFGPSQAIPIQPKYGANDPGKYPIKDLIRFSNLGDKIFVWVDASSHSKSSNLPGVTIWSYTDGLIQSEQRPSKENKWLLAILDLQSGRLQIIQQDHDEISHLFFQNQLDKYILMNQSEGLPEDYYWNRKAAKQTFLVETSNGARKKMPINFSSEHYIDPSKRFIVGFDEARTDLFSYEIETGLTSNLTKVINIPIKPMIERDENDRPKSFNNKGFNFAGWSGRGGILVYDEYDIWEISLDGTTPIKCLTSSFGRSRGIKFRLGQNYPKKVVNDNTGVILVGFNTQDKQIGFYKLNSSKIGPPILLSTGPYYYTEIENKIFERSILQKADHANSYIMLQQAASRSPNIVLTKDFKTFLPISAVYPERKYNWLTSELISFTTLDGRTEKAILYKPENFSPKSKYPVIFHFYERKSQLLNKYYSPGESSGELDIPWFVSNGYIVCCPDIHFEIGQPSKGAYNSVVAVAQNLAKYPWVNPGKMGIQGHSFGGYEVNCLVTQTKMFAAAISCIGVSNLTSEYLAELRGGNMAFHEKDQVRLDKTMWEDKEAYINNSPIFSANAVVTPMLTVVAKLDRNVSYAQGIQWFMALRRLGKKIWMLEYENQNHGLDGYPYIDYLVRSTQFFDYYLKDLPPPKWMIGDSNKKEYNWGFKLEANGTTPGSGLLYK